MQFKIFVYILVGRFFENSEMSWFHSKSIVYCCKLHTKNLFELLGAYISILPNFNIFVDTLTRRFFENGAKHSPPASGQGAPTGKIRGLLTQSMFKGKMPRDLSHQKSNESLTGNHLRNLRVLENWKFKNCGSYKLYRVRGFNFGHFRAIFGRFFWKSWNVPESS